MWKEKGECRGSSPMALAWHVQGPGLLPNTAKNKKGNFSHVVVARGLGKASIPERVSGISV